MLDAGDAALSLIDDSLGTSASSSTGGDGGNGTITPTPYITPLSNVPTGEDMPEFGDEDMCRFEAIEGGRRGDTSSDNSYIGGGMARYDTGVGESSLGGTGGGASDLGSCGSGPYIASAPSWRLRLLV